MQRAWLSFVTALGAVVVLVVGCQAGRLTSCQSDSDCGGSDGKYCVSAMCVQCRGESDCRSPLICGRDHTCKSLGVAKRSD
jgi:hypothetical protein